MTKVILIVAMLPMVVGCESDMTGIGDGFVAACPNFPYCGQTGDHLEI
jgi:uncharacterized protein (DUF1499 family)